MGILFNKISETIQNNELIDKLICYSEPENDEPIKTELYGFRKKINDPNPLTRIEYLEDNKNYQRAKMNFTTKLFDYGDWGNAWFMKIKPVMLNYDGTVAYELDPNDYSKKLDGSSSDIANDNFTGNVMIGIPIVYIKMYEDSEYQYFYFCNKKIDDTYKAWSHINADGNIIPYCYMPAYNGAIVNNKLRSLSGKSIPGSLTATVEINAAIANNISEDTIWYTETYSDRILINSLLILIGKSTNTQETFGYGNHSNGANVLASGTMNRNGLFYGSNANNIGVKVFGIENYWGNIWRRIAGHITLNNLQRVKLTYGKQDNSTIVGYNITGNGYITIPNSSCFGSSGGYIKKTLVNEYGEFPVQTGASDSTYECDGLYYSSGGLYYALVGGCAGDDFMVGAGYWHLNYGAAYSGWGVGASLSCKPKIL